MRRFLFIPVVILAGVWPAFAEKVTINTNPPGASIYRVEDNGEERLLGTGTAVLKIESDRQNLVMVRMDGYRPVAKSFVKGGSHEDVETIILPDRLVKLRAAPYDAEIVRGGAVIGKESVEIVIPKGEAVTVEVRKVGFYKKTKVYYNQVGADVPPLSDSIELTDRSVAIQALPSGARVSSNANTIGEEHADLIIPKGECVTARVTMPGFEPIEKSYCYKDQLPEPPMSDAITLRDRTVALSASPSEAAIAVNGREIGKGEFHLVVPDGTCQYVNLKLEGYVPQQREYCNQRNMPVPPVDERFQLVLDEAFTTSVQSDQANVNFTVEVGQAKSAEQAWKILFQVVVDHFEIIEMSDKETGYLRTAWKLTNFPHNTIRTRVIVHQGDIQPLKYVVKIQSETSGQKGTSVKEDDQFQEWDRILNSYKNLIPELQARLR